MESIHSRSGGDEFDGAVKRRKCEDMILSLPEDVIIKIIARIPYPSIFKCRCLSRSWYSRFGQGGRCDPYAQAFQDEVQSLSTSSWPWFAPIVQTHSRHLQVYDSRRQKWISMYDFEMEGQKFNRNVPFTESNIFGHEVTLAGSLRFTSSVQTSKIGRGFEGVRQRLTVENIMTKKFKVLTLPRLETQGHKWVRVVEAFHVTADGFIAAVVNINPNHVTPHTAVHVYDSRKASWEIRYHGHLITTHMCKNTPRFFYGCKTLTKDSKLLLVYSRQPHVFIRYDIVSGQWDQLNLDFHGFNWAFFGFNWAVYIVVCGCRIILLGRRIWEGEDEDEYEFDEAEEDWVGYEEWVVYEYVEGSGTVVELNGGHLVKVAHHLNGRFAYLSGDDEHVYLGLTAGFDRFNIRTGSWLWVSNPGKCEGSCGEHTILHKGYISLGLNPFFDPSSLPGE